MGIDRVGIDLGGNWSGGNLFGLEFCAVWSTKNKIKIKIKLQIEFKMIGLEMIGLEMIVNQRILQIVVQNYK